MKFNAKTIPHKILVNQYDEAFEVLKKFCFNNLSGVEEIIRYGSVKNPGLSDLDVLLVVRKFTLRDSFLLRKFIKSKLSKYILHLPIIVPRQLSKKIHGLFPFFEYRIYTRSDSNLVKKIIYSDSEIFHFICQIRFTKFPFVLNKYRSSSLINIREFLLELSSFKHSIRLLSQLKPDVLNNQKVKDFLMKTDIVRSNIFTLNDDFTELEDYAKITEDAYEFWLRTVIEEFCVAPDVSLSLQKLELPEKIISMELEDSFKLWYIKLVSHGKANGWKTYNINNQLEPYGFLKYDIEYLPYIEMVTQYSKLIHFYSPGVSFLTIGMREPLFISVIKKLKKLF